MEHSIAETLARTAALLVDINRNSMNAFSHRLCVIIHSKFFEEMEELANEIEVDQSYFGGVCKGKQGRSVLVKSLYLGY